MRFELKLNTIRKMGFELKLSPIRKKALELKLKPKVWLRILTSKFQQQIIPLISDKISSITFGGLFDFSNFSGKD